MLILYYTTTSIAFQLGACSEGLVEARRKFIYNYKWTPNLSVTLFLIKRLIYIVINEELERLPIGRSRSLVGQRALHLLSCPCHHKNCCSVYSQTGRHS